MQRFEEYRVLVSRAFSQIIFSKNLLYSFQALSPVFAEYRSEWACSVEGMDERYSPMKLKGFEF